MNILYKDISTLIKANSTQNMIIANFSCGKLFSPQEISTIIITILKNHTKSLNQTQILRWLRGWQGAVFLLDALLKDILADLID